MSEDEVSARLQRIEAQLDWLIAQFARYEPLLKRLANPVASFLKGGSRG